MESEEGPNGEDCAEGWDMMELRGRMGGANMAEMEWGGRH
jgi:hypothetical protein